MKPVINLQAKFSPTLPLILYENRIRAQLTFVVTFVTFLRNSAIPARLTIPHFSVTLNLVYTHNLYAIRRMYVS
jgi:hypothetical protein